MFHLVCLASILFYRLGLRTVEDEVVIFGAFPCFRLVGIIACLWTFNLDALLLKLSVINPSGYCYAGVKDFY